MYVLILILIVYCVYKYDICHNIQYRTEWLCLLLLIFTIVSGYSYRLGGDNISYINEFSEYSLGNVSLKDLCMYPGRQPLWVLLSLLCKTLFNDYWFFRLIHAIILNTLFVVAVKRLTSHVFTALLFYYVLMFFEYNFQIMRQSISISIFLYSITAYRQNKWVQYYVINLVSCLFHEAMQQCCF